jgi:hypothetical protein
MTQGRRHGDDSGTLHTLDAEMVKLAAAIQQTDACTLWMRRLARLQVTKIERRVESSWRFRRTRWYAELESSDGWKVTIHSTKITDAVDVDAFACELNGNNLDVDDFEPELFGRALRCALGQALRAAQDRLDTAASDAPCVDSRDGAR